MAHDAHDVETPALLLDVERMDRNLARMRTHLGALGVPLRPHVKTAKCIEVIRRSLHGQPGGVTVSTLAEADYCLAHGITDLLYAVGMAPGKVRHVAELMGRGGQVVTILDGADAAKGVGTAAREHGIVLPVLVELDVDGHRAGVPPASARLLEVGDAIAATPGLALRGVLTHAGESYACRSVVELEAMAERERAGALLAATRLREQGHGCEVVSVGSTPTATFARSLAGVTEVRAGVYMFQDLMMAGLGVCPEDHIALSVLVTVIGHQPEKGWILTDGGWMALSRDRSTASLPVDQGYGVVRSAGGGRLADDLLVIKVSQEHGILARREGGAVDPAAYPVGTQLRVLPNHACATAAQFRGYWALGASGIEAFWERAPVR